MSNADNNKDKAPRPLAPGSLEAKMKLLALLPYDERARRRHCLVFGFIVDWYHSKYGDALASSRHVAAKMEERRHQIPNGKSLSPSQTHSTLVDLVAWTFLTETKGKGRWASRYIPNWALVCSPTLNGICVPSCPDTISVPSVLDNGVPSVLDTNGISVPSVLDEDPLTGPGQRTGLLFNGNTNSHAAPTAPPGSAAFAPAGADAARVPSGFDEFWAIFPKKVKRQRTRLAYEKLSPDADLHARIIAKVKELAAHHKKHETPFEYIKEPANWLAGECWEEDMPAVYQNPKDAAISKRKAGKRATPPAANSNVPARDWEHVEVVASEIVERPKGNALVATLRSGAGDTIVEEITLEHANQTEQDRGQKQFEKLRWAMDLNVINDSSELHGIPFERRISNGKPEYRAPAKDVAA